jgi:pimeloyl-ACP methyl ester carboxylesterase
MPRSTPVDGFSLAYADAGAAARPEPGSAVVLLHGYPGDSRHDYRAVIPLLEGELRVVAPDLRGFGKSDRHLLDPDTFYSPSAQARSIAGLIDELGLVRPVLAGYDIGSRVAQAVAKEYPASVGALALAPPMPGSGRRVLGGDIVPELWYQYFYRSPLSVDLLDGQRDKIRDCLRHFWLHWSGPDFVVDTPAFEHLVDRYARPGAFESTSNWYRVGAGYVANALAERAPERGARLAIPVRVLWQELDPFFPRAWADRIGDFFADVTVLPVDGIGHFAPLEAPREFAAVVKAASEACSTAELAKKGPGKSYRVPDET